MQVKLPKMQVKLPNEIIVDLTVQQFGQGLREGWVTLDDLVYLSSSDSWEAIRSAHALGKLSAVEENFDITVLIDAPKAYAKNCAQVGALILAAVAALSWLVYVLITMLQLGFGISLVIVTVLVIIARIKPDWLFGGYLTLILFSVLLWVAGGDVNPALPSLLFGVPLAGVAGGVLGSVAGYVTGRVVGLSRRSRYQLPSTRAPLPEGISVLTPDVSSNIEKNVTLDEILLEGLTSANWNVYQRTRDQVMDMGSQRALPLVEAALARLAGQPTLNFYRPGGVLVRSPGASEAAYLQIMQLAVSGQLLADPAATQRLIVMVGNRLNGPLMDELSDLDNRALQIYQLLGLQMQLRIMAG